MRHHDVNYLDERVEHVLAGVSENQWHGNEVEAEYTPLDCKSHTNVEQGGTLHCGRVEYEGECPTSVQQTLQRLHVHDERYLDKC